MQLLLIEGIEQFQSIPGLSDRLQSYLLQHEAEHNLLHQAIGYEPVCDWNEYEFG